MRPEAKETGEGHISAEVLGANSPEAGLAPY